MKIISEGGFLPRLNNICKKKTAKSKSDAIILPVMQILN